MADNMKNQSEDPDWEGPRGRSGRPDTPRTSSSSASTRYHTPTSFLEDDMCNPLSSARSDETAIPSSVPVPAATEPVNPTACLPASVSFNDVRSHSVGHNTKRNAFAARASFSSRDAPPPPLPILKKPSVRSSSAPPSPPKMDDISKSPNDESHNKPLPLSPSGEYTPRAFARPTSPASASRGGLLHPLHRPGYASSSTPRRSGLTTSETSEIVKAIKQKHDAVQQKFDTVQQKCDTLQQNLDTLQQNFDTLQQKFDTLQQNFDTLQQKFDADLDQVNKKSKGLDLLQKKVNGMKKQLDTLFQDHTVLSGKHTKLGDNLSASIFKVERDLNEENLKLRADHERLRAECLFQQASHLELSDRANLCITVVQELNDKMNQCVNNLHDKIDDRMAALLGRVEDLAGRVRGAVSPAAPSGFGAGAASAQKQTSIPRRAKQSPSKKHAGASAKEKEEIPPVPALPKEAAADKDVGRK